MGVNQSFAESLSIFGNSNLKVLKIENLSEYIENISRETPKVYKIEDKNAEILKNPVFKDVALGDNVIVYEKAAKIVVFRKSVNKIISVFGIQK
jgi:hypothetical protein